MLARYRDLPRQVWLLCFGAFLSRAGAMVMPYLVLYLTSSRGFSPSSATLVLGAFGVGSVGASLIGGALADRVGRKPVMVGALALAAVALTAIAQADGDAAVVAAIVAFAVTGDAYRPAASAMLGDLTPGEAQTRAYALMYVAVNLGFTVGSSVGGWLVVQSSYDTLFVVDAVAQATFAVLVAVMLVETLPARGAAGGPGPGGAVGPDGESSWRLILGDGPFLGLVFANFVVTVVFIQAFSTLPLEMAANGVPPDVYGRVMAVNGALIVALQLPLAEWLGRRDRGLWLAVGAGAIAVGFALHGVARAPLALVGCVAVWTMGEICMAALAQPLVVNRAPAALRARYLGTFSTSFALALCVGPPLGGYVFERFGGGVLWAAAGVGGLVGAGLLLALRRRLASGAASSAPTPMGVLSE
jgi:predicted MFS family arabinose efflux permease